MEVYIISNHYHKRHLEVQSINFKPNLIHKSFTMKLGKFFDHSSQEKRIIRPESMSKTVHYVCDGSGRD